MSDKPECSATVFGPRVHSWQCQRTGVIKRYGKWYCKQHDPEAVEARRQARDAEFDASRRASGVIYDEGRKLAKTLGVNGDVYYSTNGPFSTHGYTRHLVLSFDDCRKLVEKLQRSHSVTPAASGEAL